MNAQKFSHSSYGKTLEIFLIIMSVALIVVSVLLVLDKELTFMSILVLMVSNGSLIWITYKYYKPAFTEVIFSRDSIISKTHFEQEKLLIDDIKGIWYYKYGKEDVIMPYSEKDSLKNCIVIIGNINSFNDVEYVGLNGVSLLCDSFRKGYTTLIYRKKLDELLYECNRRIKNNSIHKQ